MPPCFQENSDKLARTKFKGIFNMYENKINTIKRMYMFGTGVDEMLSQDHLWEVFSQSLNKKLRNVTFFRKIKDV